MSTCAYFSKFGSLWQSKQGKFQQKNPYEWKLWILNFQLKWSNAEILRNAYNFAFVIHVIYFSRHEEVKPGPKVGNAFKF